VPWGLSKSGVFGGLLKKRPKRIASLQNRRKCSYAKEIMPLSEVKVDALVKSQKTPFFVIPAEAGIQ